MYYPRVRPATLIEIGHDWLEEHANVFGVQAYEDRPCLEDKINSVQIAVAGDLFQIC